MTEFDPAFALKVMKRLQQQKNREAADLYLEKFDLLIQRKIGPYGHVYAEFNIKIQDLWRQADSYDSVIKYLKDRIWSEKTRAEKVWETMADWGYDADNFGVQMVEDVFEAARQVDNNPEDP